MRWSTRTSPWITITALSAIGGICACGPTSPDKGNGYPPSFVGLDDRTVFVGEPIDVRIAAADSESDPLTYSLIGATFGATIDPSSGLFSWRPALADTGEKTIVFRVSDGVNQVTDSTKFTVIMPQLTETEAVRLLRPLAGETYYYGDTLTIAFAIKWCAINAFIEAHTPDAHTSAQAIDMPARDVVDSTDSQGRVCRFARLFEDRMLWIGYYRFPLVDQVANGDTIDLGGGTARADSIRIKVSDVYVDQRGPVGCASTTAAGVPVMFALVSGVFSEMFSVVPR